MIKNNKGITLVELVVTIAIMGIVSVGIQAFTLASAKINSNVTTNVKLQYESQLVMANVQKQISNASKGVFLDGNKLLMVRESDGEEDTVSILVFDYTQKTLYYGEDNIREGEPKDVPVYKLAENITDFDVEFKEITETVGENTLTKATQADISLKIERNGKEYTGIQSVALRNKPEIVNNWIVNCVLH